MASPRRWLFLRVYVHRGGACSRVLVFIFSLWVSTLRESDEKFRMRPIVQKKVVIVGYAPSTFMSYSCRTWCLKMLSNLNDRFSPSKWRLIFDCVSGRPWTWWPLFLHCLCFFFRRRVWIYIRKVYTPSTHTDTLLCTHLSFFSITLSFAYLFLPSFFEMCLCSPLRLLWYISLSLCVYSSMASQRSWGPHSKDTPHVRRSWWKRGLTRRPKIR